MSWIISISQKQKATLLLTLLFLSLSSSLTQVIAQPSSTNVLIFNPPQWETKDPPPGRREDSGRRGGDGNQCERPKLIASTNTSEELPLTAIARNSVRGLTIKERPTFWFYIPYQSTGTLTAELSLFGMRDGKERRIYQGRFLLTSTPGIVSIPLPENAEPLEEGKDYRWVFTIVCNPNRRIEDVYVQGVVNRISLNPNLSSELSAATPEQQAILYARSGIWHETVTTLADDLRRSNPQLSASLLANLLQSVGLSKISREKIVECCTPPN